MYFSFDFFKEKEREEQQRKAWEKEQREKEEQRQRDLEREQREKEEQRQRDLEREQREKEEQRQRDWEREQQEKESELAKSIKKELEEELGIESDFDGSGEGSILSESQIDDGEGSLMDNDEHIGVSHELSRKTGDKNKGELMDNDGRRAGFREQPRDMNRESRNVKVKSERNIPVKTGVTMGQGGVKSDFDEQESSQWDSSDDEGGENVQGRRESERTFEGDDSRDRRGTEESPVSSVDIGNRVRRDTRGSEGTFEDNDGHEISENPEDDLVESEGSFGSEGSYEDDGIEMNLKQEIAEHEKIMTNNNNNIVKEPILSKEEIISHENVPLESIPREQGVSKGQSDTLVDNAKITQDNRRITKGSGSPRRGDGNFGDHGSGSPEGDSRLTEDTRESQMDEDDLLEAYKVRQEEMLEQERTEMEEEIAQKEQERLDEMRLQLERRQEEERRKMAELERQRKEREMAMEKEREEYENEMKRKQAERRKAEEERKRKEMERLEEMKRKEDESQAR